MRERGPHRVDVRVHPVLDEPRRVLVECELVGPVCRESVDLQDRPAAEQATVINAVAQASVSPRVLAALVAPAGNQLTTTMPRPQIPATIASSAAQRYCTAPVSISNAQLSSAAPTSVHSSRVAQGCSRIRVSRSAPPWGGCHRRSALLDELGILQLRVPGADEVPMLAAFAPRHRSLTFTVVGLRRAQHEYAELLHAPATRPRGTRGCDSGGSSRDGTRLQAEPHQQKLRGAVQAATATTSTSVDVGDRCRSRCSGDP